MPTVTLDFNTSVNTSLSVGDNVFYLNNVDTVAEFETSTQSNILYIGTCSFVDMDKGVIQVSTTLPLAQYPPANSYIFFAKSNVNNMSSMLGYYASVKMVNNSTSKAELFSVGVDTFESSK